jgi:hypothetical protein
VKAGARAKKSIHNECEVAQEGAYPAADKESSDADPYEKSRFWGEGSLLPQVFFFYDLTVQVVTHFGEEYVATNSIGVLPRFFTGLGERPIRSKSDGRFRARDQMRWL